MAKLVLRCLGLALGAALGASGCSVPPAETTDDRSPSGATGKPGASTTTNGTSTSQSPVSSDATSVVPEGDDVPAQPDTTTDQDGGTLTLDPSRDPDFPNGDSNQGFGAASNTTNTGNTTDASGLSLNPTNPSNQPTSGTVTAGSNAANPPSPQAAEARVTAITPAVDFPKGLGDRLPAITWTRSYQNGTKDAQGHYLGGTEVRSLVAFDGKLFAGNGYWMETDFKQAYIPGPQVLVLDGPNAKWREDASFDERMPSTYKDGAVRRYQAVGALAAVRFRTDGAGNPLPKPVDLLVAGVWDHAQELEVFVRDVAGTWTKSVIVPKSGSSATWNARSFIIHRDKVTHADVLLAGTNGQPNDLRAVFAAVYDPSQPGGLKWTRPAESWGAEPLPDDRVMSFANVGGDVYASVCAKIYRRVDGAKPTWQKIYQYDNTPADDCPPKPKDGSPGGGENGFRGLTTVRTAAGKELMLTGAEGRNFIGLYDPSRGANGMTVNKQLEPMLRERLQRTYIGYTISAYNKFDKFFATDGLYAHLFGIEARVGDVSGNWHGWERDAWFVIRYGDGRYDTRRIAPAAGQQAMVSVRTLIQSPFPGEKGRVIYAGGFDANSVPSHNTGWIYRGELGP